MKQDSYLLGITGSIGMGKSTTTKMFADEGCPVWDADATVHELYEPGEPGFVAISDIAGDAIGLQGVDRPKLKELITKDPALLDRIEAAVHPLVTAHRQRFLTENRSADVLVFDIPLLFETNADSWLDGIVVVTAPPAVQRERVLTRAGMTEEVLQRIIARQMPDTEKRLKADFVISTAEGMESVRKNVRMILQQIKKARSDA